MANPRLSFWLCPTAGPFLRLFTCEQDLSHECPDGPLLDAVASGEASFVVGAIAGGGYPRRKQFLL